MAATLHGRGAARRGDAPDGAASWLAGAAVALAATAPMAMLSSHAPASAVAAAPPPAQRWELTAMQPAVPAASASAPDQPSTAEAGQARVWRERHTIVVAARRASRAEVARQLAALTGVDPQRPSDLLRTDHPLTLHWRGTDAAEAWRLVLGSQTGHALQCVALRCRLWLSGGLPDGAEGGADVPAARPMAPAADPGGAMHPYGDGSTEPEAGWAPTQPDPPGLFPTD